MHDYGSDSTEKAIKKIDKKIQKVYAEAEKDIQHKIDEFNLKYKIKEKKYFEQLNLGIITQDDFDAWKKGQVFQSKQWEAKKESIANVLKNSNEVSMKIINNTALGVCADNVNFSAYEIEKGFGTNFGFGIYDETTVSNLIKNQPDVLPKWKINEPKDYVWNKKKMNNAVTQGIIQGEKLDDIAKRVSSELALKNKNKMKTFAATAMTSAQNAGRELGYRNAKRLGIDLQKEWMATLDRRTRESHRHMDGEIAQVKIRGQVYFSNGCRFPGDPEGPAREVYNCRCTLVADLVDYPEEYERYDNIDGKPIENMSYHEWEEYKVKIQKFDEANKKLVEFEKSIAGKDIDKVFSNIWANDVTYNDWEQKKGSIQSKKDYYDNKINELSDKIANGDTSNWAKNQLDKFQGLKDELEEFEKNGQEYYNLLKRRKEIQDEIEKYKPKSRSGFNIAYSEERKNAALWARDGWPGAYSNEEYNELDKYYDSVAKKVHANKTPFEHEGYYHYTWGSGPFNQPLAGFDGSWSEYNFVGVGKINIDKNGYGDKIRGLTTLIEKSSYDRDIWLQSGQEYATLEGFLGIPYGSIGRMSEKDLEQFIGVEKEVPQFLSGSINKGGGSYVPGNMLINIYCPQGAEMLYVQKDGHFEKNEHEMILQRGGTYKITKIYKGEDTARGGQKLIVDMELKVEKGYNKFQQ